VLDARHEIRPFARDDDTKRVPASMILLHFSPSYSSRSPMDKIDTTSRHIDDVRHLQNTLE
jgi:hypothetical protein